MAVEQLTPDHSLWPELVAHLEQHRMASEVLLTPERPRPALYVLAAILCAGSETEDHAVIGHIALKMQRLAAPALSLDRRPQPLVGTRAQPLRELFVRSFAVDAAQRRRGHGRALQRAALELAERLGCYQLRSWSSLDKAANYALKLIEKSVKHRTKCRIPITI